MNGSGGCCGGYPGDVYEFQDGYVLDKDYPYVVSNWDEKTQECSPNMCDTYGMKYALRIFGYDEFHRMSAEDLKKEIWMYGPLAVYMEVPDAFHMYKGGIFDCSYYGTGGSPHYVVAVGFGPGYIALRNSWGPNWGLEGDFLVSDEDRYTSCQVLGPGPYLVMTRVSPKPLHDPPKSSIASEPESLGFRVVPISTVAIFVSLCFFIFNFMKF